uniref:Uncharacterized protein n=2 Tax=unclassified bacterial viruses TaxID=12333 RepID=A0AAU6VXR8_9VIRU
MEKAVWVNSYPKYELERKRLKETNDCTVISFCEVWGAPYEAARTHLSRQFKRPARSGPSWASCDDAVARCPKTKMERLWSTKEPDKMITINQFCKKYPEGRYWVFVRGHALAIIDGVVHDHSHKPRRKVKLAFRVHV